jgi:DNA replication protein
VIKVFKDNKKLVAETIFIREALKKKLSLNEFLLLLYFDNSFDSIFDIKTISKTIEMSEADVIDTYGKLIGKKLINIKAEKDEFGKIKEKVSLDNFYNDIKVEQKEKDKENDTEDIFSTFERSFGRTLSVMDCEIINAWMDKGFSVDLIKAALKEAVYNGTTNLRYIDKVLYEWNRKGIKNSDEIKTKLYNDDKDVPLFEASVLNFNWLDDKI